MIHAKRLSLQKVCFLKRGNRLRGEFRVGSKGLVVGCKCVKGNVRGSRGGWGC